MGAALAFGLTVGPGVWRGAAAQTEGRVPGNTLGEASSADIWRSIRGGEGGVILTPDVRPDQVLTAPFGDCVKAGNCTERAVGFTMPIHATMPAIHEPQGKGASREALALLAVAVGGGLIALALFVRRLGRAGAGEMPDHG